MTSFVAFSLTSFFCTCSGELFITELLDYETAAAYVLYVRVTDGEFTDQAKVTVEVLNENDHDPEFSEKEYIFDVPVEKKYRGSPIGHVTYFDHDGDHVTTVLAFLDDTLK